MTGNDVASTRYRGEHGRDYFSWQSSVASAGVELTVAKFAPHVNGDQVILDFGCGAGEVLAALPARQRIGVEVNPSAAERARANGLEMHESLSLLEPASVDLVISNHALEHTLDPWRSLNDLRRVLQPRGKIVLWLPLDDWRTQKRSVKSDRNHHLFTWTPQTLSNLLVEAGFSSVDCRIVTSAWPPHVAVVKKLLPERLLGPVMNLTARILRRRQLAAVAVKPLVPPQ